VSPQQIGALVSNSLSLCAGVLALLIASGRWPKPDGSERALRMEDTRKRIGWLLWIGGAFLLAQGMAGVVSALSR